jgi:hypothetical protein
MDRFLIGYNSDGAFRVPGSEIAFAGTSTPALDQRVKDFGLRLNADLRDARAVVIAAEEPRVREVLSLLPGGARCFVYGLLSPQAEREADRRNITLLAATATSAAFRLPEVQFAETQARKALVVTHGPAAVLDGLEALRSIVSSRLGKLTVRRIDRVWETAYSAEWRPLLAAAFSRSNTIQGDPVKDGRPQDVVGLHFLQPLVSSPRAWMIEHADGLRSGIFDCSGALADLNFAVELNDGSVRSAQLYRPPAPMSDHFSVLADRIERFFRADQPEVPSGLASLWQAAEQMNR